MPKQAFDHSGNFCASSAQSKSFTPVQRDQTAVVGCSVLGRSQPSCLASSAATPEASTTQRCETVLVSDCESLPGAIRLTSTVCGPPGVNCILPTLAGRQTSAPTAVALRNTSSSNAERST